MLILRYGFGRVEELVVLGIVLFLLLFELLFLEELLLHWVVIVLSFSVDAAGERSE